MKNKMDIRKRILYVVLGLLILLLARNSVDFASSVRYMLHPYNRTPAELYELESWVQDGSYRELIGAMHRNRELEEEPLSDTAEHEALARYIEAAFDSYVMRENGKQQEALRCQDVMQDELEKITSYRFLEIVRAVEENYRDTAEAVTE